MEALETRTSVMSRPIKIIAHGDSWFDYPRFLFTGGGIPRHLSKLLRMPIKNLAHHGYGTEEMLSIRKRKELEAELPGSDILLFSGGGNDIAGDQFCIWLNDNKDGNLENVICWERLDEALDLVIADYDDLAQIRDEVAPNCLIVSHGYDFPPPSKFGVGVLFGLLGPWLQPSLDYCGWKNQMLQAAIVAMALRRLNTRMVEWTAVDPARRLHVSTQGILIAENWANEMHPNRNGFQIMAEKFEMALEPRLLSLQETLKRT